MEPGQLQKAIAQILNSTDLQKLGAHGGSTLIADTSDHAGQFTSFYVREDTVVNAMTGLTAAKATQDFKTLFNISSATLKAGDLYIAPSGFMITLIDLTSGSIIAYS
jgi:hypothetical protein